MAVIVTYRRPAVLEATLEAIGQQSLPVEAVVVVDNDAGAVDEIRALVQDRAAIYVPSPANVGYGAGIALGISAARDHFTPDAYWVMDDDSTPAPGSLALLVEVLDGGVGVAANRGGNIRFGRIRHSLSALPAGRRAGADFTLIDGALVAAAVVEAVGLPRTDLFMMMEDFEYTTRARRAGFRLVVVGGDQSEHRHLGSMASWRSYYQARNLLRIAIDRRSPSLLFGWAVREAGIWLARARLRDFERISLRARGIADALSGRMGHAPGLP